MLNAETHIRCNECGFVVSGTFGWSDWDLKSPYDWTMFMEKITAMSLSLIHI